MKRPVTERIGSTVLMLALIMFCVAPLVSMLTAALQPQGTFPSGISWPEDPQWHNFADAWRIAEITPLLSSSLLLVLLVVPISALLALLAGYALGQLDVPGASFVVVLLMVGLVLPKEATIIPLYYQLQSMGLLNSRIGLAMVLIGTFMPFAVYWMRAHFLTIPKEIHQAAEIDGANSLRHFWHIQLPLALPAISSMCLLLFLWTWNTFLQAIVLIEDPSRRTMAGALQNFVGQHSTDVVLLNAGSLLIMAPTVLAFLFFQRHFIKAMISGAVKG